MSLASSQVLLYAANEIDYQIALSAAVIAGIPSQNVIGDFQTAWWYVVNGNYLVIAVGAPALNALYYNSCGWANPAGQAGGSTPFALVSPPINYLPGRNYFESGAGNTAADTLSIATAYSYYAVNGTYPSSFSTPPNPISPYQTCLGIPHAICPCMNVQCLNGLDTDVNLSSEASCMWMTETYSFVARYLGGPCYPGQPLTLSEAQTLSKNGFYIVSIYSGANYVPTAGINCGVQTYAQGQADAIQAVNLAQSVNQPLNTTIYLDIEANQGNSNWLSYAQGWTGKLASLGYLPGVYSSPSQLNTLFKQSWAGPNLLYWVAHWKFSGVQTPAPCPSSELSYAQLWQYVGNNTVCGTAVDIDSSQSTKGMWRL
jgi:hypothetical protein